MYRGQPDVSDEDIGIRAFHVKRARAVERAIERLRHGLGDSWKDLTDDEIEELEWLFGELWAYVGRADWDELHFGRMRLGDVIRMLTLGSQLRRHARSGVEILHDVLAIVKDESGESAEA